MDLDSKIRMTRKNDIYRNVFLFKRRYKCKNQLWDCIHAFCEQIEVTATN